MPLTSNTFHPGPHSAAGLSRRALVALLLLFALVWFGTLDYRKLIKTDEGRYATIAQEMATSGDWVTPRLNDLKYFYKPPLQYWANAATFKVFGSGEWQARLWTALTGFLGVLLVAHTLKRIFGGPTAWYGGAVLGSSLLWVWMGHLNTLDMGLAAAMTLSFCGLLLAAQARRDQNPRGERHAMLAAWLGMAAAVMSKGLIGIVLPGGALLVYVLLWRDWRVLTRLYWGRGMLLFAVVTVPWFILVMRDNPEFGRFFFIHEHFERFLTPVHRRTGPVWYFLPILALGLLPWTGLLPRALWRGVFHTGAANAPQAFALRFALVWAVVIFAFFSVSSSKLPSYILPIFPALAVLLARELTHCSRRHLMAQAAAIAVLATLAGIGLTMPAFVGAQDDLALRYRDWLVTACAVLALGALGALLRVRRDRAGAAILTLAVAAHLAAQIALLGHEELAPSNSGWQAAQIVRADQRSATDRAAPFYSVATFEHSFAFYLGRPVTLVAYRDEMDFGLRQEPAKGIATLDEFAGRWTAQQHAYAIMAPVAWETLQQRGLAGRVLLADERRVLVARHPAAAPATPTAPSPSLSSLPLSSRPAP